MKSESALGSQKLVFLCSYFLCLSLVFSDTVVSWLFVPLPLLVGGFFGVNLVLMQLCCEGLNSAFHSYRIESGIANQ